MLLLLVILVLIVLLLSIQNYTYWLKRNIKCAIPLPLLGNHWKILLGLCSYTEHLMDLYKKYHNEKVVGYYRGTTPELIIRDPDLLKNIFNVHFLHFHARGLGRDPQHEPLMLNVFSVDGDHWKLLRNELTPAFTSRKLRNMFPLIIECTNKLQKVAHTLAINSEEVNAYNLMARFTIESIGACGFGLDMDTINAEKSLFVKLGEIIFTMSKKQMLLLGLRDLFPTMKYINKIPIAREDIMKTILDIMSIVREHRNNKASGRNDFVDLLLKLEDMQKICGNSLDIKDKNGLPKKVELEMKPMVSAAQLFIFFAAGFETAATAMSFTLHLLAFHQEIQNKVHEEIDKVLSKYDYKICYDAVSEMSYLKMVFMESMRIFPPGGYMTRICTKDYTVPELNLTINAGVKVVIPINALHMDSKYYDNPSEFRPERFTPESIRKRHKYVYLPFGEGLRKCIGENLGIMESLAGLSALLQKFIIEPGPSSQKEYKLKRTAYLVQAVEGGLPILLKPRKSNSRY